LPLRRQLEILRHAHGRRRLLLRGGGSRGEPESQDLGAADGAATEHAHHLAPGTMVSMVRLVGRRYSCAVCSSSAGVTLANSPSSRLTRPGSSSNSANEASMLARPKPANCSSSE